MNREQQIAVVMVMLLQNPQVGRDNTLDGIAIHIFETKILGNDAYFVDYDRPVVLNECYAVGKEADERLRRGRSAEEFYGSLLEVIDIDALCEERWGVRPSLDEAA